MQLGEVFFLCIFLIPFVLIGLAMFLGVITSLVGRIEVMLNGDDGVIRSGFGPINWTRRFEASKVKKVAKGITSYQTNGRSKPLIQIDADRTIKFGSMLPDERRTWMTDVLYMLLVTKSKEARKAIGLR
jgi:hypothetical protein